MTQQWHLPKAAMSLCAIQTRETPLCGSRFGSKFCIFLSHAVLALQNGMTAAELTRMQGRCRTTQTRQSYAEHMNQTQTKQKQKTANKQQYLKEEQQQAVQVLDDLINL